MHGEAYTFRRFYFLRASGDWDMQSFRYFFVFTAALLLASLGPRDTLALQVSPLVIDMGTVGPDSRKVITVVNSSNNEVPMELKVNLLDLGPDGELIRTEGGEDDFLIFPPQTIIPAGATQTFRIQWIGDPDIPKSRSYNISVNQIPVEIGEARERETSIQLQIVYSFLSIVTVRPPGGTSSFQVRNVERARAADGNPAVALTIENTGNLHNYLANAHLILTGADGWQKKMSPAEVSASGSGLVLPGNTRRFVVSVPDLPMDTGSINARVDFNR